MDSDSPANSLVHLPPFADTLERLRVTARLSQTEWCDLLGVFWQDYQKLKFGEYQIDDKAIDGLASYFQIPASSIIEGQIDFSALALKRERPQDTLPEKYQKAAFSRRRSVVTSVDFLESRFGWRLRADALNKLELPESVVQNPYGAISVQCIVDLCTYLKRRGFTTNDFFAMGVYSYEACKDTLLGRVFSELRNPTEIYEVFITEAMKLFESNCRYTIHRLSPGYVFIEVTSDRDVAAKLKVRHIGSKELCEFKAGLAASIPLFHGLPAAKVREVKCVHRGDSTCLFEISHKTHSSTECDH